MIRKKHEMRMMLKLVMIFAMMTTVDSDSKLQKVIGEVSSVARLVNGIALQNGLSERPEEVDEVMDELLDVRGLGQLAGMDVDRLSKELSTFRGSLKWIAALRTQNVTRLEEGIRLLEEMKGSADILQSGAVNDTSHIVKNAAENQEAGFETDLKTATLETVLQFFKTVNSKTWDQLNHDGVKNGFIDLRTHFQSFITQLGKIKNYKNELVNLLKLEKAEEMLKGNVEFGNVSRFLSDNLQTFTSVHTDLVSVSDDIDEIDSLPSGDIGSIAGSLKKMSGILKSMNSKGKRGKKTLTASFTNGNKDVKLIEKDLETSQLLKYVSNGKDLSIFKSSLKQLMKFSEGVGKLEVELKKVDGKSREKFEKMTMLMSKAAENIGLFPQVENLKTSLDTMKDCVKDIKAPTASFDHTQLRTMAEFSKNVSEKVGEFRRMLEEIAGGNKLKSMINGLNSTYYTFKHVHNLTQESKVKTAFENIKSSLSNLPTDLENLKTDLENLDNFKIFEYTYKHRNWDLMGDVLQSLDGTKLPEALKCLQQASYYANGVGGVLSLRISIEEVKNNEDAANSVVATLPHLSAIKKGMVKVKSSTGIKTRRRRDTNLHFRSAQQVSLALGRGIGTLISYDEILKNKGKINGILKADRIVHSAAQSASAIWTDSLRNKLQKTLGDLKKLDGYAGSLSLEDTWNVFQEAGKIEGVNIDATLLEDPIAKTLQNDSDATVQSSASSFQSMSQLDLAFTQHRVQLASAAITLVPIRSFFDEFTKGTSGDKEEDGGRSIWIIVICCLGVVSVLGLLAAAGWFYYRTKKQEKKTDEACKDRFNESKRLREEAKNRADAEELSKLWNERERYWIYEPCRYNQGADGLIMHIGYCVDNNKAKLARRRIKEGACLDVYVKGYTLLHRAVGKWRPDVLRLLIEGGADRSLLCCEKRTAEEHARYLVELKEKTDRENEERRRRNQSTCIPKALFKYRRATMDKIFEVFESLRDKTFKLATPLPLPRNVFRVRVHRIDDSPSTRELERQFMEKLPLNYADDKKLHGGCSSDLSVTHDVVDTDEDGVLDLDKTYAVCYVDERYSLKELVFSQTVLVSTSYLKACVEDEDNLANDYEHRIQKVRYRGTVYSTVDEWKKWMRFRAVPCLHGIITYSSPEIPAEDIRLMELLGDNFSLSQFYLKRKGKPFWFPKMRHHLVVVKRMEETRHFTAYHRSLCNIMLLEEFFAWLLSMNGYKDLEEEHHVMHHVSEKKYRRSRQKSKSRDNTLSTYSWSMPSSSKNTGESEKNLGRRRRRSVST